MKQVQCGVRMDLELLPPDGPLHHFGTEEINDLLKSGAKIVSIDPPSVIMKPLKHDSVNVTLTIIGFSLTVNFEEQPC